MEDFLMIVAGIVSVTVLAIAVFTYAINKNIDDTIDDIFRRDYE